MLPSVPYPAAVEAIEALLDEEAALLDLRRGQFASLCAAIVDHDDDATERLLDQMERAQQLQDATDAKVDAARGALADAIGCPPAARRLSDLIDRVDQPERTGLAERRERVIRRIERLQREHMRAVVLLSECARINRLLTDALFPGARGLTTYSAAGRSKWHGTAGLVNTER